MAKEFTPIQRLLTIELGKVVPNPAKMLGVITAYMDAAGTPEEKRISKAIQKAIMDEGATMMKEALEAAGGTKQ